MTTSSVSSPDHNGNSLVLEDPTQLLLPHHTSSSPSSQSDVSSDQQSKRERERMLAARRRRAYNERTKSELALLRHQEGELSVQLAALKKRVERIRRHRRADSRVLTVPAWKGLALLQMEQRLASEALNERLRRRVEGQNIVIQELYNVLQRQSMENMDDVGEMVVRKGGTSAVSLELADTLLFETYLKELDVMYAQTDAIFRECGLDLEAEEVVKCPHPWAKMDAETKTEFWECAGAEIIALPFHMARLTLWPVNQFFHLRQEQRQFYQGVADPDNALATKFRVNYRPNTPDAAIPLIGRMVMRRYREADRSVIVWRTLHDGEGAYEGMHTDETGWCIVRPTTDRSAIGAGGTIVQMCGRFIPSHFSVRRAPPKHLLDAFSEIVIQSVTIDCEYLVQMMEDMLVSDT